MGSYYIRELYIGPNQHKQTKPIIRTLLASQTQGCTVHLLPDHKLEIPPDGPPGSDNWLDRRDIFLTTLTLED